VNIRSVTAIYAVAALACVLAPALALTTLEQVVVWPYVLFAGLPLSVMAILLATVHAQYGLVDGEYRRTARVWVVGAVFLLTPFELWRPFQGGYLVRFAGAIATASIAVLFMRSTVRAWRQPWMQRIALTLGFCAVAMFFAYRAWQYVFPARGIGVAEAADALAGFFLDAVITCVLLLPGLVAAWMSRRSRPHR